MNSPISIPNSRPAHRPLRAPALAARPRVEPARHPFHEPQLGSDNVEVLDREAVVGEPVDRPLGGFVVVEARDGVPRSADRI